MKHYLYFFMCLLIAGCGASGLNKNKPSTASLNWHEKPGRQVATITFGIPTMHEATVRYSGKNNGLHVVLGEPEVISIAGKPFTWGYYQFPTIARLTDGSLHAEWSMHADAVESYGSAMVSTAISSDNTTWRMASPDSSKMAGYLLPNGDMIKVFDPKPVKATDLAMPEPVGVTQFRYRKTNFTFYRLKDMPAGRNGVYLNRLLKGTTQWKVEQAALDDPKALRYTLRGLVPVVWWGDMHTMADSSIVAGVYPGYYIKDNGQVDKQMGVVFYRSTDNGHSWKFQGRIPFTPDTAIDSMAKDRIGFSEPAYELSADGSLVCVIRSADGDGVTNGVGNGPMYVSRSVDMGKTWTKPEVIAPAGALPRLLRLENGVMVLSSGRPGVQLRFSKTGFNDSWTDPFEMLAYQSQSTQEQYLVSCGYTGLLATGPNRFLLIYSDFRHLNAAREVRKAIMIREVTVDPR